MRVSRPRTRFAALVVPAALAVTLVAGCGGSSDSSEPTAAPNATEFPSPAGQTLEQIARKGDQSDLAVVPSESVFHTGENRYGFGVFTVKGDNVPDAQIALYASQPNKPAVGPFTASSSSLKTDPSFQSQTTATDPDAAKYVYTTTMDFPKKGSWQVLAMVRGADGKLTYSAVHTADVAKPNDIPDAGDPVPKIHTPTAGDVGGDLTKIDTRTPPSTMHETDLADVLGKEPVVLLFATPALCTSRVCGPVVDIAEQVKSERPDDAAFIHMEIYNDNDPNKGPRPEVKAFGLQSEPWLFVIGSDGKVSTRIEGAFSADELNAALDKVS